MQRRAVRFATPPTRFESLQAFHNRHQPLRGSVEIQHGALPLHFFWNDRGHDTTIVTFSGAIPDKVEHVPAWIGLATTREVPANRLLISDPTLILSPELRLAWNAGSQWQPDLQRDLTGIIRSLAGDTRIVLFGPSGGGFAALEQATRLPGSTVIASNPQTDVRLFTREAVERYLTIGWGIHALDTDARLPFAAEVLDAYSRPVDARVVYVQNAGDRDHVEKHYEPFRRACHPSNQVGYLLPDLGWGHLGPDKASFVRLFQAVCAHRAWDELWDAVDGVRLTREAV